MSAAWRRGARLIVLAGVLAVSGCATYNPITMFHRLEGKAAPPPPPAPGLDQPSPNLASVPPKPPVLSPQVQRSIRGELLAANTRQNALPAPAGGRAPALKPVPPVIGQMAPVLVAFQPGRAIVPNRDLAALRAVAAHRGRATIVAIGFAPARSAAGLHLALLRATAIADILTAAGAPGSVVRIEALTAGRGGAAQLLYPSLPQ
ncbi:hypothetical protein [Acidiphilium sp.]|uniref:hypothetical protein n=1 Tax=Acidiphilium sp. TaxID=527 RepID=UPI003CFC5122